MSGAGTADQFVLDPDDFAFDLEHALDAVVAVQTQIPDDAFTASVLGTERRGSGVVIEPSGLVLTIGYLITEAERIWLVTNQGRVVEGFSLAYDQESGFGLVQPMGSLDTHRLELGKPGEHGVGDEVILAAAGGIDEATLCQIIDERPFAGYWEYLLERAIITAPAHDNWGGAACINVAGRLVGIGSLLIQAVSDHGEEEGNMIVPIEAVADKLEILARNGATGAPPRPWLGMFAVDQNTEIGVTGLIVNGPADKAGVEIDDRIIAVAGRPVLDLADFYRNIWSLGSAGIDVPLTLQAGPDRRDVVIASEDRNSYLRKPTAH